MSVRGGLIIGATSQILAPYGSASLVGYYDGGLAINIAISDPNLATSPYVAGFTAHQHACDGEGGNVWVDAISSSLGYQFTTPICNSGSFWDLYPGAVQAGICLVPINPPSTN
jgi:hypothetical protein